MEQTKLFEELTSEQKRLHDYLEDNDRIVYLFEQDGQMCAEIENWTEGGVDMIVTLMPFNIDELERYCYGFDVDEEIDTMRQDRHYCEHFSISESLRDYTNWKQALSELIQNFKVQEQNTPAIIYALSNGMKYADWYEIADEVINQIKNLEYSQVLAIAYAICPDRVAEWPKEVLLGTIRDVLVSRCYYKA